ncbi:hypothetical protein BGZ95_005750 [Linnemannia exigua]|uniref:FAD-binding domain-containing protein n=1 Tax=Linnemannia exigua TaxID=604196 RepID=A0AAD4H7K6_9FUNG|nr:hypothetical protein BGZ95_005750 [Linnemannia exigua]
MSYSQKHPNPRVIVIGAGIGGLMMGLLLGKAGITYQIFERSSHVRTLGALMSINANILPVFEQLGLMEEVENISLRNRWSGIYNSKMKQIAKIGMEDYKGCTGYDFLVFSRPEFCDVLLRQIPKDRISFNKRILKMRKCIDGTRIYCSDNSIYEGDIVIGADGAYSSVRHNMHKMMENDGLRILKDNSDMPMPYLCMVGTTNPLNPEKYPQLKDPLTHLHHVVGDAVFSWTVITIPRNRFCWSVMAQIKNQGEAKEQRFRNSEWGPEANNALIEQVKDFPITFGGTLGDMISATPKERVSKVMLEEKLFDTWHYGSVVLIGDGAMNAMQDAVVLVNCLYDLLDCSPESITAAFEDYKSQRYSHAKKQVAYSKLNAKVSSGQTFAERAIRHLVLNYIPASVKAKQFSKAAAYRPQIAFLPQIRDKGSIKSLPNRPSKRAMYEESIQRKRRAVAVYDSSEVSASTISFSEAGYTLGEKKCSTEIQYRPV